jgi:hypothetical protein
MDEPAFEMTRLREKPDADPQPHRPGTGLWLAKRRRRLLATVAVMAVVALIVSVWLPLRTIEPSTLGSASPTTFPTFTEVPLGPTPTPILLPSPIPVAGLLGAPPRDCPAAPPLNTLPLPALGGFSGPVQMTGGTPVWAVEGYFPQRVVDVSPAASTASWPSIQIMWEIGPQHHPTVTVRALNLRTGETAWWGLGVATPQVPVLVMNPTLDFPTAIDWVPYRTLLIITHADCYELRVSWAGGSWYTIFAAGQTSTAPAE